MCRRICSAVSSLVLTLALLTTVAGVPAAQEYAEPLSPVGQNPSPQVIVNLVQWQAADGGNDHWYGILAEVMPWVDAYETAKDLQHEGLPGYLATIESPEENEFIFMQVIADLVPPTYFNYFYVGARVGDGGWYWCTAVPVIYSNWAPGEPDYHAPYWRKEAVTMLRETGQWKCVYPDTTFSEMHQQWSIVEFSEPGPVISMAQWRVEDGGNDHWYGLLTWPLPFVDAVEVAQTYEYEGMTGYLATVTSGQENLFIFSNVLVGNDPPTHSDQFYIGGSYISESWQWLNGETMSYFNWALGEPNNMPVETAMSMWYESGKWNNAHPDVTDGFIHQFWSVLEFAELVVNRTRWPATEGGNGHSYAVIAKRMPWNEAMLAAQQLWYHGLPGYLATITSQAENDFIVENILPVDFHQPSESDQFYLGGCYDGSQWTWLTGEPFLFAPWAPGEPDNLADETALALWGYHEVDDNRPLGYWNNVIPDTIDYAAYHQQWSVIEWPCCEGYRGNANGDYDDKVGISDVSYLMSYLFGIPPGLPPPCPEEANANGDADESINISDVTYLLDYLFGIPAGPLPPPCP